MTVRWALTPRGRVLALLVALALLGYRLTDNEHTRLVTALLAAPLALDLLAGFLPQRLRLSLPARQVPAGEPFLEHYTLANEGRVAPLLDLRVHEPRTLTHAGPEHVECVAAGQVARFALPARGKRRGSSRHREVVLEQVMPFGFSRRITRMLVPVPLVLEPARVAPAASADPACAAHEEPGSPAPQGSGAEFHALREHGEDQDLRGVHALRSAALGRPVRRIDEAEATPTLRLVLDLRLPASAPAAFATQRVEERLGQAAWHVDRARATGTALLVLVAASEVTRHELRDPAASAEFLAVLAACEAVPWRELDLAPFLAADPGPWLDCDQPAATSRPEGPA
ncbi:MAG: hypothetical protein IT458_14915 [Planctomycetes bacterium]|nr:hypothetical protein [Planctomycetota bacterium]